MNSYPRGFDEWQKPVTPSEVNASTFRNRFTVSDVINEKTGRPVPGVKEATLIIASLADGHRLLGTIRQSGPYSGPGDAGMVWQSNLLTDVPGILTEPITVTSQTSFGESDIKPLTWATVFGKYVQACGGTANNALAVETSTSNPALTLLTYTPGSVITGLWPIVIGGATAPVRLAVGRSGGVVEVLSDVASPPTSFGTMHANTTACWGIISSPLNSTTPGTPLLLIYSNGNIYTLDGASAIGTAPTVATASVPNGGYAVGIVELPGEPQRAFWVIPKEDQGTTSMLDRAGTNPFRGARLASTNLEGTDLQYVALPIDVLWALRTGPNSIWVSDGESIYEIGAEIVDLGLQRERMFQSSTILDGSIYPISPPRVWGLGILKGQGYALTVNIGTAGAGYSAQIEIYSRERKTWHTISEVFGGATAPFTIPSTTDLSQLGYLGVPPMPQGIPYSPISRNFHWGIYGGAGAGTGVFDRQAQVNPGYSAYEDYYARYAESVAYARTANQTLYSPAFTFEEFEGKQFVVEEVGVGGLVNNGGCTIGIADEPLSFTLGVGYTFNSTTGTSAVSFGTGDQAARTVAKWPDKGAHSRFRYKVTLPGSGALGDNPLPIWFKFMFFVDGNVRDPDAVRAGL